MKKIDRRGFLKGAIASLGALAALAPENVESAFKEVPQEEVPQEIWSNFDAGDMAIRPTNPPSLMVFDGTKWLYLHTNDT